MILASPRRSLPTSISSLQNLFTLSPPNPFTIRTHSIQNSNNYSLYSNFFRLLSLCQNIAHLQSLKSHLIVNGLFPHEKTLVESFLGRCFHLGAPQLALSTFTAIGKPNLYLQNVVIRSLCDDGLFQQVLLVYKRCHLLGCPSDNYTFPLVIKACSAIGSVRSGKEVHCVVLRTGFGDNVFVQTALVDFYAKVGQMGNARLLHDKITHPDLVSWNALISGYSLHRLYDKVFEVLKQILVIGLKPNVSTLASIIPLCSGSGNFLVGISLHCRALKSGYLMDEKLAPALLSMYAIGGDLSVARDIFDSFPTKNVTILNAMISAHTQNQKSDDAFVLFRKMLRDDMEPNVITFVSIIPSCGRFDSIRYGESIHACVILKGFENELPVAAVLISLYSKLENIDSAEFIFSQMPHRNILTWNSMVSGYVHNECWEVSLVGFREMQIEGFDPDPLSIVSILSSCSRLGAILLGKSAHAFSHKKWIDTNLTVSNALLSFYSDCLDMTSTYKIFQKMAITNIVSWNALISGFVHNGEAKHALTLLHQMQKEGMDLDMITLISVLPCFNEAVDLVQGMIIHSYAIKRGFASDVTLANALISMYVKCGELDSGKFLFENLPNRSVVSWNALITGYRHQSLPNEVMVLFGQMAREGQKPNYVTLLNLLPVCSTHLQGKSIHAYAARSGFLIETPFITALMLMYGRFGNINSCLLLFQIGKKSNISLWNAIISAAVQSNFPKMAVSFFCELLRTQTGPDYITFLSLSSACIQLNDSNITNSILAYVIQNGFDKDVAISNAFIDLYARSGNIKFARMIFHKMPRKDAISWSVIINGYALHGDGKSALGLLSRMRLLGLIPDEITYISILSACSHAGLVDQARTVFNSMVEQGMFPQMEHYACLVNLLGRTGHLVEAYEILKSLPYKPSVNMLESFLGSCLVHGNVELGEEIGELVLEMDPETSGPYIILYNLYAAAGRWTEADRVRSEMERKQVTKVPGFSLLK